jgi:hypothetical protein
MMLFKVKGVKKALEEGRRRKAKKQKQNKTTGERTYKR